MAVVAAGGEERQMGGEMSRSEDETRTPRPATKRSSERTTLKPSFLQVPLRNERIHNSQSAGEDGVEELSTHIDGSTAES